MVGIGELSTVAKKTPAGQTTLPAGDIYFSVIIYFFLKGRS